MQRIDVPEEDREDFYLYVDEFQNFATEAFATILSEARKYRLNLIMAHQYVEQLDEKVIPAVFGNVGTIISFRIGATDAEVLAKEYAPQVTEEDLVSLSKYQFYLKLMIDGVASTPFSAQTIASDTHIEESNAQKIIQVSRERYSVSRDSIEDKILRWTGAIEDEKDDTKVQNSFNKKSDSRKNTEKHPDGTEIDARCDNCGNSTIISFEPDGIRPVFCKDCLKLPKEDRDKIKPKLKEVVSQEPDAISLSQAMKSTTVDFKLKSHKNAHHHTDGASVPEDSNLSPNKEVKLNQ
jgi:CxxC-x17-CxxC domain-containing protein